MFAVAAIIHFIALLIIIIFSSLGNGIGGGLATQAAIEAINIQPGSKREIIRLTLLGLALIETAAILALIIAVIIFLAPFNSINVSLAGLGMACAVGIPALLIGIVSSLPVQKACLSIARQPFFVRQVLNVMLITQSIIQAGIIFGFIVAWIIHFNIPKLNNVTDIWQGLHLLAAGLAIGLGSIGPTVGLALFAQTACDVISFDRKAYGKIISFVLISGAFIETPLIFALMVALTIVITPLHGDPITAMKMLAASLCISLGTFSPGLNSSKVSSTACKEIAHNNALHGTLSQTSMFGQGLIDAAAVYALLIALLMIFVT